MSQHNHLAGRRMGDRPNPLQKVVQGVAGGIGLVSEGVTAYKARKNSKRSNSDNAITPVRSNSDEDEVQGQYYTVGGRDDEEWELDQAQDELVGGSVEGDNDSSRDITRLAGSLADRYPPPPMNATNPLPCPVVLPQRRPKDRSRGFVRAYAPVLENRGIDQEMFIDFLETFNKASLASPWLNAINLASIGTMFMPHGLSIAVSIAIQIATDAAKEVQARSRTNSFLDKTNADFFRPRGLFCLVLTWNPESSDTETSIDLAATISKSLNASSGHVGQKIRNNLRTSNGVTAGNLETIEAAPLIFPALDVLAAGSDEESKATKHKLKSGKNFVEDYLDRRAQAKFAGDNPENLLAQGPKPKFTSRFADPNHPAVNGSVLGLLTGGKFDPLKSGRGDLRGGVMDLREKALGGLSQIRGGTGGYGGYDARGAYGAHGDIYSRRSLSSRNMPDQGRSTGHEDDIQRARGFRGYGDIYQSRGLGRYNDHYRGAIMDRSRYGDVRGDGLEDGYGARPSSGRVASIHMSQQERGARAGPLGSRGPIGGIQKILKKDVSYLMIVNMPSEAEMVEARHILSAR